MKKIRMREQQVDLITGQKIKFIEKLTEYLLLYGERQNEIKI